MATLLCIRQRVMRKGLRFWNASLLEVVILARLMPVDIPHWILQLMRRHVSWLPERFKPKSVWVRTATTRSLISKTFASIAKTVRISTAANAVHAVGFTRIVSRLTRSVQWLDARVAKAKLKTPSNSFRRHSTTPTLKCCTLCYPGSSQQILT